MRYLAISIRAAVALMSLVFVVVGLTAQSATAGDHDYDSPCEQEGEFSCWYDIRDHQPPLPNDVGGDDALAVIRGTWHNGGYLARFSAYDEVVFLEDGTTDGHQARVDVIYITPNKTYHYSYATGTNRHIQLGKDDNLTENRLIMIRVCIQHHNCSPYAAGRT